MHRKEYAGGTEKPDGNGSSQISLYRLSAASMFPGLFFTEGLSS
jgi:hypothetical protein